MLVQLLKENSQALSSFRSPRLPVRAPRFSRFTCAVTHLVITNRSLAESCSAFRFSSTSEVPAKSHGVSCSPAGDNLAFCGSLRSFVTACVFRYADCSFESTNWVSSGAERPFFSLGSAVFSFFFFLFLLRCVSRTSGCGGFPVSIGHGLSVAFYC